MHHKIWNATVLFFVLVSPAYACSMDVDACPPGKVADTIKCKCVPKEGALSKSIRVAEDSKSTGTSTNTDTRPVGKENEGKAVGAGEAHREGMRQSNEMDKEHQPQEPKNEGKGESK